MAALRVMLAAFGSRGDVMPRVAVGQELQRRGHAVAIGCAARWQELVASCGLSPVVLGDYPAPDTMAETYGRIAQDPEPGRRGDTLLRDLLVPMLPQLADALLAVEASFDLVVLNDLLAWLALPPIIDPHRLVIAITTQPVGGLAGLLRASPCPKLIGSSPMLLPSGHDLDATFEFSDFWLAPPPRTFEPDPILADFLSPATRAATCTPVVAVAFGSAWGVDPQITRRLLVAAAIRANVRLVVQDLDGDSSESTRWSDGVGVSVGEVPYAWLFERVEAVVHHGGAGTIAEALRAGRPSVVVPQYGDHLYWALRLAESELSVGTVLPEDLNEDLMAAMLKRGVGDTTVRTNALQFSESFHANCAISSVADRIVELADRSTTTLMPCRRASGAEHCKRSP